MADVQGPGIEVRTGRRPQWFDHHPGRATLSGLAGLFILEVGEAIDVATFVDGLSHVRIGMSWAGSQCLAMPGLAPHQMRSEASGLRCFGISPHAIRFGGGLEHPGVIGRNIERALTLERR